METEPSECVLAVQNAALERLLVLAMLFLKRGCRETGKQYFLTSPTPPLPVCGKGIIFKVSMMSILTKKIILIVILFLYCGEVYGQSNDPLDAWEHVATYDGFVAPDKIRLPASENSPVLALLLDSQALDQMVAELRLDDKSIVGQAIRSGDGPGEVSGRGLGMSLFSDGGVLVWDGGAREASVYDRQLQFEGQVRGVEHTSRGRTLLVNDSTMAVIVHTPGPELINLYRLHRESGAVRIEDEPVTSIQTTDDALLADSELEENIMLRQGTHRRVGDQLFFALNYSSIVLSISEDGLEWATADPENHSLPVYDFRDDGWVMAPAAEDFPQGTLDVAADESYLYVLYSGQQAERPGGLFSRFTTGDIEAEVERIRHSDRLFIFERDSGAYLEEIILPVRAKAMDVSNEYIGLITDERESPTIEIYRMPKQWER